jgi:pimeloyl-ACP methyl ester carboxylesterase
MGRSLGSGVASYVAGNRPVQKLVLVTPFDSLAAVAGAHYPWLPTRLLVTERFDSRHWLRDFRNPVLVIRSGRDQVIPPANTDRLVAAISPAPRIVHLPEAGHDDVLATQAEIDALVDFLAD